ncbi:response regulator [Mucilaginibacter endophyticus]|uniref:response regulator n=1 Tax=Mucilaginibacter endophyticus TaxID=2675003 RepID=UPI000E0D0F8B|nr:response regulator [Mucilaginibacter endophyticus]
MSKRIMVIDDNEDILEILNIVFQDCGYDVILSNTGEAAHNIVVIHPDLILLDVNIVGSEKTGAEICREIKSNYLTANLPVMLVSAETDLDLIAVGCGANSFVRKPFDIYELLMHVKQYLS